MNKKHNLILRKPLTDSADLESGTVFNKFAVFVESAHSSIHGNLRTLLLRRAALEGSGTVEDQLFSNNSFVVNFS